MKWNMMQVIRSFALVLITVFLTAFAHAATILIIEPETSSRGARITVEGNIAVAKFPLATTETFKDRTGKLVSQTEWHTVVLWRGLAELAQKYLHKSSLVYIEGRLRTRSWDDKDGHRKFATEVVGDNLIMLDKRADGGGQTSEGGGIEGIGGGDIPMGDPSESLPF